MPKPVGGRGRKSFGSTHIRVPLPIEDKVRQLVAEFYEEENHKPVNRLPTLEQAIDLAKNILAKKKSAKISLSQLLEAIYGETIEL